MSNKKQTESRWIIKAYDNAGTKAQAYEQVGNKLVDGFFLKELLEQVDGIVVDQPFVLSIPELIDEEFLGHHLDCHHAVMTECLIHLFTTKRIDISLEK